MRGNENKKEREEHKGQSINADDMNVVIKANESSVLPENYSVWMLSVVADDDGLSRHQRLLALQEDGSSRFIFTSQPRTPLAASEAAGLDLYSAAPPS